MRKVEPPMGDHWKETNYPPLYQLYRRTETVAAQLSYRQQKGWAPLKKHVEELFAISVLLEILDSRLAGAQKELKPR